MARDIKIYPNAIWDHNLTDYLLQVLELTYKIREQLHFDMVPVI